MHRRALRREHPLDDGKYDPGRRWRGISGVAAPGNRADLHTLEVRHQTHTRSKVLSFLPNILRLEERDVPEHVAPGLESMRVAHFFPRTIRR